MTKNMATDAVKPASSAQQANLLQAVSSAIQLTRKGDAPNAAIEKIARQEQLSPESIRRVVETFNRTKAASYLSKSASEDERSKDFPIADAKEVISAIFASHHDKVASEAHAAAMDSFKGRTVRDAAEPMQKCASTDTAFRIPNNLVVTDRSKVRSADQVLSLMHKIAHGLQTREAAAKLSLERSVESAAYKLRRMQTHEIQKMAQLLHNASPHYASPVLNLLEQWANVPMPKGLQKTAHAAVFPGRDIYIDLQNIISSYGQYRNSSSERLGFEKHAAETMNPAMEMVDKVLPSNISERVRYTKDNANADDVMDAATQNRLKAMESKRALYHLLLGDEHISKHPLGDVIKSYNLAVGINPDMASNPTLLRNTILRNLQTGGIDDPAEMKTHLDIAHKQGQIGEINKSIADTQLAAGQTKPAAPVGDKK